MKKVKVNGNMCFQGNCNYDVVFIIPKDEVRTTMAKSIDAGQSILMEQSD